MILLARYIPSIKQSSLHTNFVCHICRWWEILCPQLQLDCRHETPASYKVHGVLPYYIVVSVTYVPNF
jgi:hypothetical protein